jgi:hypothetical protein
MAKGYKRTFGSGTPSGPTPGLETLFIIPFAPVLAALDLSLTWVRMVKEYDKDKNNNENIF